MDKRIAIAIVLIAAVFVGGYFLYGAVFNDREPAAENVADASVAAASSPAIDAAATRPETAFSARIVVTALKGKVERKAADGAWIPLVLGDQLTLEDEVRTAGGGAASLDIGDMATVDVAERTSVGIAGLSKTLSRLELQAGRVSTKVHGEGGARLRVEVRDTDAVAETGEGEFSVLSSGTGQVTVAATEGQVQFSSRGETVAVKAGEQSVARPNLPPSPPKEIPASFYLKLRHVSSRAQREKTATIRGTTTPGAVVSINGLRKEVDDAGQFETSVTLREGRNQITVVVEDATGRRKQQTVPVTVDSKAPDVETGVEWGRP